MSAELVAFDANAHTFAAIEPAYQLAERISRTEFVPTSLRGKPEAVMACILTGHEVGVGPMQALSKIHVIEGRPAMSAELMRAIVMRAGHELWFSEVTNTRVTIVGRRQGWPSERESKVTWTLDDAKRAQIDGKQNWRKWPRAMLKARATAELCRDIFADVLGGISYTVEELTDGDVIDVDEVTGETPVAEQKTHTRKASGVKRAAAKKAAAPKPAEEQRESAPLPPLPGEEDDDIVDAEIVEETAAEAAPTALTDAQKLVIICRDAGFEDDADRYALYRSVANRDVASGNDLTDLEAARVRVVADFVKSGDMSWARTGAGLRFFEDDVEVTLGWQGDTPALVLTYDEAPSVPPLDDEPTDTDAPPSDAAGWKAAAKAHGMTLGQLVQHAAVLADAAGCKAPGGYGDLAESELAPALWAWLEEGDR